jgi:hypothetical protein
MNSAAPKPTRPSRTRSGSNAQAAKSAPATTDKSQDSTGHGRSQPAPNAQQDTHSTTKRLGGSRDILLSLPLEEKERMVNTVAWTGAHIGIKHNSRFIRYAIARLCAELEQKYNNGEPYGPPAEPAL